MEIRNQFIPARRSSKLGWYEKFQEQKFLLNNWSSNISLIGDSLISNISRYEDVWFEYFAKHNWFNFGIPGDKIQNLLWSIKSLKFPSNSTLSCIFILWVTNNVNQNSPVEVVPRLISFGISVQAKCHRATVVIIPLFPRYKKFSLSRGNINIINSLSESECSKYNLCMHNHKLEWLNADGSLNESLFYSDNLHLFKEGNELLPKEIVVSYKHLKSYNYSTARSYKKGVLFYLRILIPQHLKHVTQIMHVQR